MTKRKLKTSYIIPVIIILCFIAIFYSINSDEIKLTETENKEIDPQILQSNFNPWEEETITHIINKDYIGNTACDGDTSLPQLIQEDKGYLIDLSKRARTDFFGRTQKDPSLFLKKYDNIGNKVFISFRINGIQRGSWSAQTNNLAQTVYDATINTMQDIRYQGSVDDSEIDQIVTEVYIIGHEQEIDFINLSSFNDKYSRGVYGVRFEKDDKSAAFYNTVQLAKNYNTGKLFERLCLKAGFEIGCHNDPELKIKVFNTYHFLDSRFSDDVSTLYRGNTFLTREELTKEKIQLALDMGKQWMIRHINPEGKLAYRYVPTTEIYPNDNNVLRQYLGSFLISKFANEEQEDNPFVAANYKNLKYNLNAFYTEPHNKPDQGFVIYNSQVKLGTLGLAVLSQVESPHYESFRVETEKIAKTILELQYENGSLEPFYIHPTGEYDYQNYIRFYAGESTYALAKLYQKTKDKKYLRAAVDSANYYISYIPENYNPAFVPWITLAFYEIYKITGDRKYVDFIFELTDRVVMMQHTTICPFPDFLGRFYDPEHPEWGEPFSGSSAIYTEGIAYAYDLAKELGDVERQATYKEAALLGALNIINLQYKGPDMFYLQFPERASGGLRYKADDNRIRIDTTQHGMEALLAVLKFIDIDEQQSIQ